MAELGYQNPNQANTTAQLESELRGTASDGATELRREIISMPEVVDLLQQILNEIRSFKTELESMLH